MQLSPAAYHWITRMGEIGILWPAAIVLALWMLRVGGSSRLALGWLLPLGAATFVTSVSKIAFLGWGYGIAALDFTGFSGHAMFSAAIYPVLAHALAGRHQALAEGGDATPPRRSWRDAAVPAGYAFALLIAYSRVVVHAHSWSEAISGFCLGAVASGCTLYLARRRATGPARPAWRWGLCGLAAWLAFMPSHAGPTQTHGAVTALSIRLAGRQHPFTRADLHAAERRRPPPTGLSNPANPLHRGPA